VLSLLHLLCRGSVPGGSRFSGSSFLGAPFFGGRLSCGLRFALRGLILGSLFRRLFLSSGFLLASRLFLSSFLRGRRFCCSLLSVGALRRVCRGGVAHLPYLA